MMGGNMPENRPLDLALLTNPEVLAVNQRGEQPKELYHNDSSMVWYSHAQGSKDIYVALFNLSNSADKVKVDFEALGLKGKINVRDLWLRKTMGAYRQSYQYQINRHGAALLRLSVQ